MYWKALGSLKKSPKTQSSGGMVYKLLISSGISSASSSISDSMQGQKIHELRDEIAQLRREEALLDHHREYIQGILKSMSENKSFKRYLILMTN